MESCWGRMQADLLDRQRRHSSIEMLTPNEYEKLHHAKPV